MSKVSIFSYRYMWQTEGDESVNFKIHTDTCEGLKSFEDNLLLLPGIKNVAKEYLHEYDCSKIGVFEPIKGGENNEKS